ncbi:hypothetical protein PM082_015237 [Marasmius tenuissimus]|nr:hypothetical protein PM082_015237 [Marasmius tenuissimus]
MASCFHGAQHTTIGANATVQAAARDIINNIYSNTGSGDRVTLCGRTFRKVIDGDIIFRRQLSSEVLIANINSQRGEPTSEPGLRAVKVKQDIAHRRRFWSRLLSNIIKPRGRPSTSTASLGSSQVVRVKKTKHTAEIVGYSGVFTAITLELVDENDQDLFEEAIKTYLEAATRWRSALLVQVFAVAESSVLTLIVHDELANGVEFAVRYYSGEKEWIVFYYLNYTFGVAIQSLRYDEATRFPVTRRWEDWSFNPKTLSWHYDLASISLNPPSERDLLSFLNPLPPLRQDTLPQLNTAEITAHIEETLGDVLHLIASVGNNWAIDLPRHGLLTFGAVVNRNKRGILAHLSSTSSPEWYCQSRNSDVKASLSGSGMSTFQLHLPLTDLIPGRVDLTFHKTGDVQVHLKFGLRIPDNDRNQLCCAYLSQSLHLCNDSKDVRDVVYVDRVGFNLKGTFFNNPTTCNPPAYLFVPHLRTELINNLYCVRHPLPQSLFYWARDRQGRNVITEEDWKEFGIPELRAREWIGSWWDKPDYTLVQSHLRTKNYDLDGRQYARDHGHPELIFADPHGTTRIQEFEDSNSDTHSETSSSQSQLASPLSSSPVEAPGTEDTPTLPTERTAASAH